MTEELHRSQSMNAYVETFGEPDEETEHRVWGRVRAFVETQEGRRRRRNRVVLIAAAVVVALAGAVWATWGTGSPRALNGLVEAEDSERIELHDGGTLTLAAGTRVRVVEDAEALLDIELLAGEIDLVAARRVRVRVGAYTIDGDGGAFRVRPTGDVPLVTVLEGSVHLAGPALFGEGVELTAPPKSR